MSSKKIRINRECIVRDRPCGRVFGGSNICFIASPSPEEVGFELELIKNILNDEEIEPYVAVEHIDPAKDIFCSKICTKIIESKLCIAILTGSRNGKKNPTPNPNVYYEYGLMNAWGKQVIPLQRDNEELSFNIKSLDTVKYSQENFTILFKKALRVALSCFYEEIEESRESPEIKELLNYYMELKGYRPYKGTATFIKGLPFSFIPYSNWKYGAIIISTDIIDKLYFSTKLLFRRIEGHVNRLERECENIYEIERNTDLEDTNKITQQLRAKKESEIEHVKNLQIIIVNASGMNLGEEIVQKLKEIESTLNPSIDLLTLEKIREEVGFV